MNPILSGWCPPDGHDASQHAVCQMRQNDEDPRKRLEPCPCQMHGGHVWAVVERDSRQSRVESETKRGPDRANESDPLATVSTRPKGA